MNQTLGENSENTCLCWSVPHKLSDKVFVFGFQKIHQMVLHALALGLRHLVRDNIQTFVNLEHESEWYWSESRGAVLCHTCMESALITSPRRALDNSMPNWDFPTPVVPMTAMVERVGCNIGSRCIQYCNRCRDRISLRWSSVQWLWFGIRYLTAEMQAGKFFAAVSNEVHRQKKRTCLLNTPPACLRSPSYYKLIAHYIACIK